LLFIFGKTSDDFESKALKFGYFCLAS